MTRSIPVDTSWTLAPAVLLTVVVYGWIYVVRWLRVRRQDGPRAAGGWRLASFMTGLVLIVVALVSPVDRLGEQLASAHMVQHLLIADLVPIALILGFTKTILRPVTRRVHAIERRAGLLAHPVVGVIAYVGTMYLWHVPVLYDAALEHPVVHMLEHVSFGVAGALYWWHLISPIRSRLRLTGMGPVGYMASTKVLVGFLGIALAFLPRLLYEGYAADGERWGMEPLDDQHVAGLIMGLEQSIVMGIGLFYLFARMLSESEREQQRIERMEDARAAGG